MLTTIKRAGTTAAISSLLVLGLVAPVFAQTTTVATPTLGPGQDIGRDLRCRLINTRVALMVQIVLVHKKHWDTANDMWTAANQKILTWLNANFPSQVAAYNALAGTLNSSIAQARTDATTLESAVDQLQADAQAGDCLSGTGQYKQQLSVVKTARTQLSTDLKTVKTNYQAVRSFIKGLRGTVTPSPVAASPTPTP